MIRYAILATCIFAIFVGIIGTLGLVVRTYFNAHSEMSYFYEAFDALPETEEIINWRHYEPKGREVFANNEYDLSVKITEAWQAYSMAMAIDNENTLRDYFSQSALQRGLYILESDQAKGTNMVMMGMEVDPVLFHIDGSIFQFKSENALFARFAIRDEELKAYTLTQDCIITNMSIRQSGWKISNHERDCARPVNITSKAPPWSLPKLKGINYYPKNSPWSFFWRDYDRWQVQKDFWEMRSLGINSVRIFLPKTEFTETKTRELAISNLRDFFAQARMFNLHVIPTLFDFRGELTPWTWSSDRNYLDQVLPVLAEFNNIAYVDLKNELDLDDHYQSPALVEAWVRTIIGTARLIAPELRYSIGWSDAQNAMRYGTLFDVISYHEYADMEGTQERLMEVKSQAGGKPVIVSEIGATSFDLQFGLPSNRDKQAAMLNARLEGVKKSDGVLVWTLYDYPTLDPKAVSGSFWHKGIQKNFGLLDEFDRQKPAAETFKAWSFQ